MYIIDHGEVSLIDHENKMRMITTLSDHELGNMFFANAPAMLFSFIEGIAAGAMLTMIAETMLPETYFKGGSIVGISTLPVFLTPIYFKTME